MSTFRAVRAGERMASLGVLLGLVAMIAVLISVILLYVRDYERDQRLRAFLLEACERDNRRAVQASGDLAGRIALYNDVITSDREIQQLAPALQETFEFRIAAYTAARDAAQIRLDGLAEPEDCSVYR